MEDSALLRLREEDVGAHAVSAYGLETFLIALVVNVGPDLA